MSSAPEQRWRRRMRVRMTAPSRFSLMAGRCDETSAGEHSAGPPTMSEAGVPLRVAVLASGSGSNLQALLEDQHAYRIVVVISDRVGAGALAHAEHAGVPAVCLLLKAPRDPELRAAWEQ